MAATLLDAGLAPGLGAGPGGAPLPSVDPGDIHVLLVDDERLTRLVVGNLLRACKYKVTIAESGTQALEVLSKAGPGAFQLILTDVMMPDVGGLELLRFVRSHPHLSNVPVIMMSASEAQETMCAALLGGAEEYLVKPVTRKEVQNIWTHVMKRFHAASVQPAAAAAEVQAASEPVAAAAPGAVPGSTAPGAGGAGGAGSGAQLMSLGMGLSAGLGLPPEVARDVMRAAALAASTTSHQHPGAGGAGGSGGGGDAGSGNGALDGGAGGNGSGGAGAGAGLPDDAAMRLALMAGISNTNTPGAGGGAAAVTANGTAAASGADAAAAAAATAAAADLPGAGAQIGAARGGAAGLGPGSAAAAAVAAAAAGAPPGAEVSKVNLLKWLRRPSRTVQPKESFWIFCEVLLLLESCQASHGPTPRACGLRPSRMVLYSNGRVAFVQQPAATAAGAAGAATAGQTGKAAGGTKEGGGAGGGGGGGGGAMAGTPEAMEGVEGPGAAGGGDAAGSAPPAAAAAANANATAPVAAVDEEEALYRSPEEEAAAAAAAAAATAGSPAAAAAAAGAAAATAASDMFSLGLLFLELFFAATGPQQRAELLREARQRVLPPAFSRSQPKEAAFTLALLHPDPACRPTLAELLSSAMFRATTTSLRKRAAAAAAAAITGTAVVGGGGAAPGAEGAGQQQAVPQQGGVGAAAAAAKRAVQPHAPGKALGPGAAATAAAAVAAAAAAAGGANGPGARPGSGGHGVRHRLANGSGVAPGAAGDPSAAATAAAGTGALAPATAAAAGGALAVAAAANGPHAAGTTAASAAAAVPAGAASAETAAVAAMAAPPGAAAAAATGPGAGTPLRVDDAVLLEFLHTLRKRKLTELAAVESELGAFTADASMIEQYLLYLAQARAAKRFHRNNAGGANHASAAANGAANDGADDGGGGSAAAAAAAAAGGEESAEGGAAKDASAAAAAAAAAADAAAAATAAMPPPAHNAAWYEQHQAAQSKWVRIATKYPALESVFVERRGGGAGGAAGAASAAGGGWPRSGSVSGANPTTTGTGTGTGAAVVPTTPRHRHADAGGLPEPLLRFAEDLSAYATFTSLTPVASLRYGDPPAVSHMVAGAAFDRDDEFFAVAGVSKRIKIFEREAVMQSNIVGAHYPVLEISSRSRLSSVTWSGYIKGHLASADYEGLVQLWDANTNTELLSFEEHGKRVWSIDFSQADPARLLSGGDDGLVKLWNIQHEASTSTLDLRANVCSVQFSPHSPYIFAAGAANYRIFLYDLRHAARALHVIPGHARAVSYVRWLSPTALVSASTDSTVKLWALDRLGPDGLPRCAQTFRGHTNERNFTGLSVSPDGYICCGSENNRVFCYHQSMPMPVASYDFASGGGGGGMGGLGGVSGGDSMIVGGGGGGSMAGGGLGAGGGAGDTAASGAAGGDGGGGGGGGAGAGGSGSAAPPGQFVSSVCWSRRSNLLLAANSVGAIKLFTLS